MTTLDDLLTAPLAERRRHRFDAPQRILLAPMAVLLATIQKTVERPSILIVASIGVVCLPPEIGNLTGDGRITAADLIAGLLVAVVAVNLLRGDRAVAGRGWLPFAAALFSFALATVIAADVVASAVGFIRYAEIFVLVPVAVAMSLRDRLDVLLTAGAIVAVTVVEGAYGVYQYLSGTGASYGGEFVRAVGTFGAEQIMALAALVGYGLVITLALALARPGRSRSGLLAVCGFLVLALGFTLSRGAWIATAAAVLMLLFAWHWRAAAFLGVMAVLGAAILMWSAGSGGDPSGSRLDQRLTSIVAVGSAPDQSVRDRYALWAAARAIWADHPVTGVGMKDFVAYRDSYASVELSAGSDVGDAGSGVTRQALMSPHNQYLMVLSEQGTIGIVAFGSLLVTLAVGAVRPRRPPPKPPVVAPSGDRAPDTARGYHWGWGGDEERFLDLAAPALMVWTLIDWMYGDIGAGPSTVLMATLLGIVVRRRVIIPRPRTRETS
ncbi:O-antigen ligase family protein [Actinoplanes sp. NPDC049265]|uniref:O-antigen ligase family protein n=1 Tax=Actinoplanes sp. NPDC049265 TaxID=3363902 RepID=UPI00372292CC